MEDVGTNRGLQMVGDDTVRMTSLENYFGGSILDRIHFFLDCPKSPKLCYSNYKFLCAFYSLGLNAAVR